ncbi:MAG: hypothetical protein DHS80DRAFT_22239 [Piptocephalis tieghemiana]|nr:MAG: hypothetical protein DHS80DRAFT_22239 [Piptocephalis tieghemiana]
MITSDMDQEEALAQLKRHGDAFLESVGFTLEEEEEDHSASEEECLEEEYEHSDDDQDLLEASKKTQSSKPSPSVSVVTFHEGPKSTSAAPGMSKREYKAFMSSKVAKLSMDPTSTKKRGREEDKEEEEEERENKILDRELNALLSSKGSALQGLLKSGRTADIVEYCAEESLSGRSRRKAMDEKLTKLGMKNEGKKKNIPLKMHLGMQKASVERGKKTLQEARESGMLTKALARQVEQSMGMGESKAKPSYRRDRGLSMGVGKYKDGALHISNREIKRIESQGNRGGRKKKRRT